MSAKYSKKIMHHRKYRKYRNIMRLRLLLLGIFLVNCLPNFAQESLDVTNLLADTKTFIFNNNKNTVKGYIYDELQAKTACCGSDRIYLEVKIDPSGYVLQVKTLTGKEECFKKSAIDIVKNIKWDASDFRGPKSVYFEIKPDIPCDGRNNQYAQLEIFNNEKVSQTGDRIYDNNPVNTTPKPTTPPVAVNTPKEEPKETTPTPPAKEESKPADISTSEPVAVTPPQPKVEEPKTDPVTTESRGFEDAAEEVTPREATLPLANTAKPSPVAEADKERLSAKRKADQESVAKEEEILFLRDQLNQMRAREEELREQRLAEEKAQREREAEQARYEEETSTSWDSGSSDDSYASEESSFVDGEGGLFFDESGRSDSGSGSEDAFASEDSGTDPPKSEEDRLRDRIRDMEAKLRDLERGRQDRENRLRDEEMAQQRENEEYLRLVEEKMRMEEDYNQTVEQKELDRMEKDRQMVDEERRKVEDQTQRLVDEMERLRQEMEAKMMEVERQKVELDRLAELKIKREQEIMLERTLREKEREAQLEAQRISLFGGSSRNIAANDGGPIDLNNLPEDFLESPVDSSKLVYLLEVIQQLQAELQILRGQINQMENGGAVVPGPGNPVNTTTGTSVRGVIVPGGENQRPSNIPSNYNSASEDKSWEGVDNGIDLPVNPQPQQQIPSRNNNGQPTGNVSPDVSHRDTHANVEGPKFTERHYINGEAGMEDLINRELKAAGICNAAQAAFSVTLDPSGNVAGHRVLAANSPTVEMQLNRIIPGLKFNASDIRFNQTIYLEFKADITCEGVPQDTQTIKDLNPLINN